MLNPNSAIDHVIIDYALKLFDDKAKYLTDSLAEKIKDETLNLTTEEKTQVAGIYRKWVTNLQSDSQLGELINKSVLDPTSKMYEKYSSSTTINNKFKNDRKLVHEIIVDSLTEIGYSSSSHLLKKMQDNFRQVNIPGFDIDSEYLPHANGSKYVSGDTIIYFDKEEGDVKNHTIILGDKKGKGKGVKGGLDAKALAFLLQKKHKELSALFYNLNNLLCRKYKNDSKIYDEMRFVSAASLVLPEIRSNSDCINIKILNAGHEPCLIYNPETDEFRCSHDASSVENMVLGVEPFNMYPEKTIKLKKNEIILLYTDGLPDTKKSSAEKEERFGMDRVQEIIRANYKDGSNEVARKLKDSVTAFANGSRTDDISFIVIKYTGLS